MKIKIFEVNMYPVNTYLLIDENKEAVIVDPGFYTEAEQQNVERYIKASGIKLVGLINTHQHLDHIFGNDFIKSKYNLPIQAHLGDSFLLEEGGYLRARKDIIGSHRICPIDKGLEDGELIRFGGSELRVIHTPGHSPGSISLYSKADSCLISGDCLFQESIGRHDLPRGNMRDLMFSIRQKLFALPDDTHVLSGHGEPTTIGHEKKYNPFM